VPAQKANAINKKFFIDLLIESGIFPDRILNPECVRADWISARVERKEGAAARSARKNQSLGEAWRRVLEQRKLKTGLCQLEWL